MLRYGKLPLQLSDFRDPRGTKNSKFEVLRDSKRSFWNEINKVGYSVEEFRTKTHRSFWFAVYRYLISQIESTCTRMTPASHRRNSRVQSAHYERVRCINNYLRLPNSQSSWMDTQTRRLIAKTIRSGAMELVIKQTRRSMSHVVNPATVLATIENDGRWWSAAPDGTLLRRIAKIFASRYSGLFIKN